MAYGTPRAPGEIEAYYTDIRRGRAPTAEQLADLTRRYEAIGGISPLARLTEAQRDALQAALDERAPGRLRRRDSASSTPSRRSRPASAALVAAGAERIVGLVLAPHYSSMSIGEYLGRAGAAAGRRRRAVRRHRDVGHRAGLRRRSSPPRCAASWPRCRTNTTVVFTAHSLPRAHPRRPATRTPTSCGPRPRPSPRPSAWRRGRSGRSPGSRPGRTPEPWIGPDILAVIDDLAGRRARRRPAGVPVRVRRRPPRGALRPRHRGPPPGRRARPRVPADGVDERRPGRHRRPRRPRRRRCR